MVTDKYYVNIPKMRKFFFFVEESNFIPIDDNISEDFNGLNKESPKL